MNKSTIIKMITLGGVLFSASLAQAYQPLGGAYVEGNLLAGFTTGSGNDLVVNLGPTTTALVYGNQWNLSSLLIGNLATTANIQFGVVGISAGPNQVYATSTGSTLPNHVANGTIFNILQNTSIPDIGNLLNGTTGSGSIVETPSGYSSWYGNTIGGSGQTFKDYFGNPNGQVDELTLKFYTVSQGSSGARTLSGTFSLNASGILTYAQVSTSVSTNAYLTGLVLNPAGTLSPVFATNVFSYVTTEAYGNAPTVTATDADLTATNALIYNNTTNLLVSGTASSGLALTLGATNVVKIQVTAQDGVTMNTYTVNVLELPSQSQPHLTNSLSGNALKLSWPADHLGYRLLTQTNNLNKGISSNSNDWSTVAGSTAITTTNITIIRTNVDGYFRLVYP